MVYQIVPRPLASEADLGERLTSCKLPSGDDGKFSLGEPIMTSA